MTSPSEREVRQRLAICLARLVTFNPTELAHINRRRATFRKGLPHFERTLSLFRQVAHADLRKVPSDYLNVVADDAEKTLARFREILSFTGEGLENPKEASATMISELRDSYEPLYEKLSPIINTEVSEPDVAHTPKRRFALAIALGVAAVALTAAIIGAHYAGYFYSPYAGVTDKVVSALR
jgi:hypothetical protein